MGQSSQHQFARRVLLHTEFCADDDSQWWWTHRQYFVAGGKKSATEWRCLCGFQMGAERSELFHRGGAARTQYSSFCSLSWFNEYRFEPARWQGHDEDAAT